MKIIIATIAILWLGAGAAQAQKAELFAPGVISTGGFELGTAFSPDGKSVYFSLIGEGFSTSIIMVSRLTHNEWSTPEPVAFADGQYRDLDVALSADGRMMVFQSDRPLSGTARKDWDIWLSRLGDDGWGAPENAGPAINDAGVQTFPVITADGSLMYSANAGDGRDDLDVMIASAGKAGFHHAEALGSPPNTPESDSNATLSPDGKWMVIGSSAYGGHLGNGDLYLLERHGDGWSAPRHLGAINTQHREMAPAFSPDGNWLYFTSNRPRDDGSDGGPGDIYRAPVSTLVD